MTFLPSAESARRIEAVRALMRAAEPPVDALLLVQNVDVFYFSGSFQSGHLLLGAGGEPRLLVRKVFERAEEESPLDDVRPMTSLKDLPMHVREICGAPPWRIGMELDVLPARAFENYRRLLGADAEIADATDLVLDVRSVKSEWEIERIRDAAETVVPVFRYAPHFLKEARSTAELQALLECRARTSGHPGAVRMRGMNVECSVGVVVSGPSGALPSHGFFPIGGRGFDPAVPVGADLQAIRRDTPIILDFLGFSGGYHADQTRMAVKGRFSEEAGAVYAGMQEVLRQCERTIAPGSIPSQVYREAVLLVEERGFTRGFMGPEGHAVGFIGHSVGLEVNEMPVVAPRFDRPLRAGTVLALEPKFAHPDLGVIGIENTYVVRDGGLELLTPHSETVIVV